MSNHTLRIGIIGCGNIGSGSHIPGWRANHGLAEIVGLADPTEATLEAARELAGLDPGQVHLDPFELIARPDVDVIDIATPQHIRRDLIVAAAEHGKHIVCEKPFATIPADAAAALDAIAAAGVTLAMVHNYLWLPEIEAAKRVIGSGEIGTVRSMTINFLGIVDVPGNAGYAPRWRHDAARGGGGVLMDIVHGVYVAESILGAPLERVSAWTDNSDPDANVEDIALCRFETARNAALVNIAWGWGPGGLDVVGSEGRIEAVYRDGGTSPWSPLEYVSVTTQAGTRIEYDAREGDQDDLAVLGDTFRHVFRDFIDAVAAGREPRATAGEGARILQATVGALKSAATGELVSIPLDRDDPVFLRGVLGLEELELPDWSPVNRHGLYRAAVPTAEGSPS
jgi:predicted dehydrogenase